MIGAESKIFIASLWHVGVFFRPRSILQRSRDRADSETEAASGAIGSDFRFVGVGAEGDGLVAGVEAGHVALAAVDA